MNDSLPLGYVGSKPNNQYQRLTVTMYYLTTNRVVNLKIILVSAGEELLQLGGKLRMSSQELTAIRGLTFFRRLNEGQEKGVEPLFALGLGPG